MPGALAGREAVREAGASAETRRHRGRNIEEINAADE
jgi:hypothetical protein